MKNKEHIEFLLDEIQCDKENIQQMVNLLPLSDTKGEYRKISAIIKDTVKGIHCTKCIIDDNLFPNTEIKCSQLFECQPSEIEHNFEDMDSYFGNLD